MNWLVENWSFIVLLCAVVFVAYKAVLRFLNLPAEEREKKISAFLLHAVTMAEKEFGSGTGRLKLSYVYDMFFSKFGWLAIVFPYEKFEKLVDEVLEEARQMWKQNENVKQIIEGDNEQDG